MPKVDSPKDRKRPGHEPANNLKGCGIGSTKADFPKQKWCVPMPPRASSHTFDNDIPFFHHHHQRTKLDIQLRRGIDCISEHLLHGTLLCLITMTIRYTTDNAPTTSTDPASISASTSSDQSPFVTLISSDGFEFHVRRSAACVSGTIRRMLNTRSQ